MKTNIWNTYSSDQLAELNEINERYKSCLMPARPSVNVWS